MRIKESFLIIFLFFSFNLWAQQAVSLTELTKSRSGIYTSIQTGKLFTGKAYKKFDNGKVGMSGEIKDGRFSGLWTWRYEDGSKKRETTYINGDKTGYAYWWYKNGVKKLEVKYKNDKNIEQKRWDNKGNRLPNPKMGRR